MALVMRHPATADVAVRGKPARERFPLREVLDGRIVVPNERMSVTDRLQVYNGGYLARLADVLASDFPALQHLVGDEAWHRLCARYVDRHPSDHPNLNRFGRRMPAFVRAQRWLPHREFAVELASLEQAITEAFDAPAFTPLSPEELAAIDPDHWERAALECNPSLRLLSLRYPANDWFVAFRDDESPAPPAPARSHVAVYRRDWRVFRMALEPAAHAVLSALQRGEPLGQALQRAAGGDVGTWFREWSTDGLFTAVHLADRRRKR